MPWSFIVDEMNVPEVYYWTFDKTPPEHGHMADSDYEFLLSAGHPLMYPDAVDSYRFRIAVWTCGGGAFRLNDKLPVTIIFTQPAQSSEYIITGSLFKHLYLDGEYNVPRRHEEGVCWIFLRMYWLLTDWQNIMREIERELEEAVSAVLVRDLYVLTYPRRNKTAAAGILQ